MGKLFGTDGVRGVANLELTPELAFKIGEAAAGVLLAESDNNKRIILGRDTRISGDMLASAVIAGVNSAGVDIIDLEIVPTPAVSYLTSKNDVIGGIMISASHNPIEDNGIKVFGGDGCKISEEIEGKIEDEMTVPTEPGTRPTHDKVGRLIDDDSLKEEYIKNVVSSVKGNLAGLKVVLDCGHGAGYQIGPDILGRLGITELITINDGGSGNLINVNCGSTDTSGLIKKVKETGADLGIALDGDADRAILVDNNGNLVDGDKIMYLSALSMQENGSLKKNKIVTTKYSNLGLDESLAKYGIEVLKVKNGDKYVLEGLKANQLNLGGEKSGHIIYLDYNTSGDGILTAVQVMNFVSQKDETLVGLLEEYQEWPQLLENVRVKTKDWEDNQAINEVITEADQEIEPGRVFVRASGTEPVVRVMLEGKERELLEKWRDELASVIGEELN
ncbi:MAG: phosphoglucosamine mutase [Halanaerobiaceae bacterium]